MTIQGFYGGITNELGDLKTSNDEDQVIFKNLLKLIHCLSYDVYINDIDMDLFNKVEIIKQYRQTVMNSENVFFSNL